MWAALTVLIDRLAVNATGHTATLIAKRFEARVAGMVPVERTEERLSAVFLEVVAAQNGGDTPRPP